MATPWPVRKDGDDGGCELCHNEYDNTQNECPVAIRERILFLREREAQKVKVRQQQQEGKEEGDGDMATGVATGQEEEEEEEEALAALALLPTPPGYKGASHIYRPSDPLPAVPPPLPSLMAIHSQQPNEEFPFNFGVRMRRSDPSHPRFYDTIYWHCLASDKCRACNVNKTRSGTCPAPGTTSSFLYYPFEASIRWLDCLSIA